MARGTLRVYLGAVPGVGKTFAALGEARRRAARGTDVVVGVVETHGRDRTADQLEGLEVLPRATVTHRGVALAELDVDGVLARHPEVVVVVVELAHTNAPGSRNRFRWQDVEEFVAAGIGVVTTVNVQHLASLTDAVAQITGVTQGETVPDEVVRRADQVELVDMSPESLRRRLAHGNVYPAERVDAATGTWFRVGNLTALRELALLWLADRVDEGLRRYRAEHDIDHVWETRERVVVALTGGPEGETLVRRAARVARRGRDGVLLAVHVIRSDGLTGASPAALRAQRTLVESLGGTYHQVVGDDVATALLEFARGADATQLVVGTSRRSRWARAFRGGIGGGVVASSGEIDVHIVTHAAAGSRGLRLPPRTGALTARRHWAGLAVALVGVPTVTALCLAAGPALSLASVAAGLPAARRHRRVGRRPVPGAGSGRGRRAVRELVLHRPTAGSPSTSWTTWSPSPATWWSPSLSRQSSTGRPAGPPLPRVHGPRRRCWPPCPAPCWPATADCPACWSRSGRPSGCSGSPWSRTASRSARAARPPVTSTPSPSPTRSPCSSPAGCSHRATAACWSRSPSRPPSRCTGAGSPRPPRRPTGGGLTMVLSLRVAPGGRPASPGDDA